MILQRIKMLTLWTFLGDYWVEQKGFMANNLLTP